MVSTTASRRYAKGLLQIAIETNQLDAILSDMQFIRATFEQNRALQNAMVSPIVKDDVKKSIISEIFGSGVSDTTTKLIVLLSSKSRLDLLSNIAVIFEKIYNVHAGIIDITITSAYDLDKKQINAVTDIFSQSLGLIVKPTIKTDKRLIGGLTVKYHDTVVDGSVKNKLEQLSNTLQSTPV